MSDGPVQDRDTATVALLPAMDRFEDFYDTIGVPLDQFRDQVSGGWLFNYVDALRSAGIRTVVFFASAQISSTLRFDHRPSGATICVVPSPLLHRKLQGARDRFLPGSRKMRSVLSYVSIPPRLLARELRRERCQAILCQEYENARFDVCVLLGRLLRLPVFATFQGATEGASGLEHATRRLALHSCAGLIIGAGGERARVQRHYRLPPSKLAHIPNPIEVRAEPLDRGRARVRLGVEPDARVVVWHGRVQIELKGLDILLESWGLVCRARPDVPLLLLLVGSGNDAQELRRLLRSQGMVNVRWVDRFVVDREELLEHLAVADVFALPSRREGFAVAALEAMACALPIVAAEVNGIAEILEDGRRSGGVVVPPSDAGALADALGLLLDDEQLRRELGARARRQVERRFSLEVVGEKLRQFMTSRGAFHANR